MKKALKGIIVLSVAVLTLALVAGPALGYGCFRDRGGEQINAGNTATVTNNVSATSYTDLNTINDRGGDDDNTIRTGDAYSAAGAITVANTNVSNCGCREKQVDVRNTAVVINLVNAMSETGRNTINDSDRSGRRCCGGGDDGDNTIVSGDAYSAAGAITVVNSNIERSR